MTKQISHSHFHFVSSVSQCVLYLVLLLRMVSVLLLVLLRLPMEYIQIDRLIRLQSWFFLLRILYDFTISQCSSSTNSSSKDFLAIDTNTLLSFSWCFQMCDRYIEAVIRLSAVSGPDKQPITCMSVCTYTNTMWKRECEVVSLRVKKNNLQPLRVLFLSYQ